MEITFWCNYGNHMVTHKREGDSGGTGYAHISPNTTEKICYECCAKQDTNIMNHTGKYTLYLPLNDKLPSIHELEKAFRERRATCAVDRINHREYVLDGVRYYAGWSSEGVTRWSAAHGCNVRDVVGWVVYRQEEEQDAAKAGLLTQ